MSLVQRNIAIVVIVGVAAIAVGLAFAREDVHRPPESQVQALALTGPLSDRDSEISGLAWDGDELIILPQFPNQYPVADADGSIFRVGKAELARAIERNEPVEPSAVAIRAPGLLRVPGYQGFEAVAFDGDRVYLTVELDSEISMDGLLLQGRVDRRDEGDLVTIDVAGAVRIHSQTEIDNLGYEAITLTPTEVVVFHEANGAANPRPRALRFDRDLKPIDSVPMAPLEYRVTDATSVDANGRFWVTNYFYPETEWTVGPCALRERFGDGDTHCVRPMVERLVELRNAPDGVEVTGRAPVQLALGGDSRNWEGVVRYEDGFLMVTDTHPETVFAYVAR
ncbi:MAG: hypothetical protein AAGE52_11320 [Myxococcota bacterium]